MVGTYNCRTIFRSYWNNKTQQRKTRIVIHIYTQILVFQHKIIFKTRLLVFKKIKGFVCLDKKQVVAQLS